MGSKLDRLYKLTAQFNCVVAEALTSYKLELENIAIRDGCLLFCVDKKEEIWSRNQSQNVH